jgi:hypothetical protein
MIIKASTRKEKRFMATFNNGKTIHFGSANGQTFIDHGDKIKRENYINRHKKNEDWTKVNAGSLSRFLLWGDYTTLEQNHNVYMKKFNIS